MIQPVRIAVVGLGYAGLVAAAGFAEIGHDIVCIDSDERKVGALRAGKTPIHEKNLPELLKRHRGHRIRFTTDMAKAAGDCDALFIAVGTPQSDTGDADLTHVEAVAEEIARSIRKYIVLVEKSTVPVCTSEWIRRVIERNGVPGNRFDVVSNPEFLREGSAVTDFLHPSRIVIGAKDRRAEGLMQRIYEPLTSGSYYRRPDAVGGNCSSDQPPPLVMTSPRSAEIIKHASNAFLAMKVSFINSVANFCEAAGADVEEVARGIGMDSRIGNRFLRPGIGYGGSCFPKDVAAFRQVAHQRGVDFRLLDEVANINEDQRCRFFEKVRSALWNLRGKKLAVLGLAFKCDTDDIRESPAVALVQRLLAEGCRVAAYDPAAMEKCGEMLPASPVLRYVRDPYEAAEGADALLVLTDWEEFAMLDLARLSGQLRYPFVLDGRNVFSPEAMRLHGFTYYSVGRPVVQPAVEEELALAG